MTPRILFDNLSRRVELGSLLTDGKGAEGAVFEVTGRSSSVAKLYHTPPDDRKKQKLRQMLALARPDLLTVAAWPTATLHQTPQGPPVGFLMPRAAGRQVHELYGPINRKQKFPTADWAFLIQAASNCAIAFDTVHRAGHTVADVNEKNVFVTPTAIVWLLDCDSFQISAGGQLYRCDVGVDLYTPPELQGQSFRNVVRTHNHDRFGLAVLIFHLLFVGRHPFAGRPLTKGELPPDKAIKEFRFAYSRDATQLGIAPPLYAPLLSIVPADIGRLFERAFSKHSAQPDARPHAHEWVAALGALQNQLKVCAVDPGHKYSAHLSACCWCELMQTGAPNYFISVSVYRAGSAVPTPTFVLGASWADMDRVPRPNPAYRRPPAPDRIAPSVLPAHIPSRVPPRVIIPLLPEPPEPPAVAIPLPLKPTDPPEPLIVAISLPPRPAPIPHSLSRPIVIARGTFHKALAAAAIGSACLLLVALFMLLVISAAPHAAQGSGRGVVASVIAFLMISTFVFGTAWLLLEVRHEAGVGRANAGRNAALARWGREKAHWDSAYKNAVHRANAERDKAWAGWRREKSRREEGYQKAILQAVAEQDRILAEKCRAKARREEAHQNVVRMANAQRERVLADMRREKERRSQVYHEAYRVLVEAEREWQRTAKWYEEAFDGLKSGLEPLKSDYLSLKPRYEQEERELEKNKEAAQRIQFLQTQFISDAKISGIGDARKAVLLSNGVETAYDIDGDRILAIKGFKEGLTYNLLTWKEQVSRQFRFDAAAGVSWTERAALATKYKQYQQQIEAKLHVGLTELRGVSEKAGRHLPQLYSRIPGLVAGLAQAKVDVEALSTDEA